MKLNRGIAVIGSAEMAPVTGDGRSLEEILYTLVQAALKDAGIDIDDIDGIVVAANDQYDGRAISIMAASGSVGGVDRDILSTPSAGEHAFVLGAMRIASGQYETQLVVSWSPTEATTLSEVQRLGADPYFHRRLPLDEPSALALQASAIAARTPHAHDLAEAILLRNRRNGQRAYPDAGIASADAEAIRASKPKRWPLREAMLAQPVTGAVAMVLASEDYVGEHGIADAAHVTGMGWATEAGFLGDRDLGRAPALEAAARLAFDAAGVTDARTAFDVIEIDAASAYQELPVYEALGLSNSESWQADVETGHFSLDGKAPVNPSGGPTCLNPVFCTGLMRLAEAALQVRGKAGRHQVEGAKRALAHAASGFSMMYQTVVVFESSKQGERP